MQGTDSVTALTGVGPAIAKLLEHLGIATVAELADYYPRAYEDYSVVSPINHLRPGQVTIKAVIKNATGRYARRGLHLTEAVASDDTGSVRLIWFNQPYRAASIKHDQSYFISGTFELARGRFVLSNPSIELASDFPLNTARILPIYRETKGLTSRQLRAITAQIKPWLEAVPETLPAWLVESEKLLGRAAALTQLHFPSSSLDLAKARERLAFEEVFGLTLASLLNKYEIQTEHAPAVPFVETVAKEFVSQLPFQLTDAQRKTSWQIYQDMQRDQPMNRLVEGDVGSGKTVVAAMAAIMVLHQGRQVAFMAPTEILARQHAETLSKLLEPIGRHNELGLIVGSMTTAQKRRAHEAMAAGSIRLAVGTHALLEDKADLRELELIIIDEQHRFGVEQRKKLIAKAGHMPHVLNLTATPIPRSLALTLYGELDVSVLDTKPAGRQTITTKLVVPTSRARMFEEARHELDAGRQAFVVTPLIAESPVLEVTSAEAAYQQLSQHEFKKYRVGLLHGRMKGEQKNSVMQDFLDHKLDVLVSTTVIEVGVDVPNASVMIIEAAERFGLAQLHQLRGRIGRGPHASTCYLALDSDQAPSPRLRALERSSDGFKLAELDLQLRGPGAIYGTLQHGQLDLRIAQLSDTRLIARARQAAQTFIDRHEVLDQYAALHKIVSRLRAVTNLN